MIDHLGYHRGSEIGSELGFISGVLETLPVNTDKKVCILKENLKKSIDSFPRTNDEDVDLHKSLDAIKTQYKKLISILKIKPPVQEKKEISF